jgi:hypothetical protein
MESNKLGKIIFILVLLSINLISAISVNIPQPLVTPFNFTGISNFSADSDKLDGQHGSYYTGYCDNLITANNLSWLSTFNATYASLVTDNQSWNETYANTKYLLNNSNVDLGNKNITTTGTGFFGWLGSITSRITKGWFIDLDTTNATIGGVLYYNTTGACNLNLNHSHCENESGQYIIG